MSRLSIRMKLLLVFMALFTVAFAGAFLWFYQFSTDQAMENLRQDLMHSASIAAAMIDGDEHAQLYATGEEEDASYTHIAEQLHLVREANDRITNIYTMVRSSNSTELLFIVDLDIAYPDEVVVDEEDMEEDTEVTDGEAEDFMGTAYDITNLPEILKGFDGPAADTKVMVDVDYGDTLSGYAPILDSTGKSVAIVGVDMTADDVKTVQNSILKFSLVAFGIAYICSFAAIYLLSGAITKSLRLITDASVSLEKGDPFEPAQLESVTDNKDELGNLARVFSKMAVQVQARERELKQTVSTLRIEIDEMKRKTQVAEITENAEFKQLQEKAREMRRQREEEDKKE